MKLTFPFATTIFAVPFTLILSKFFFAFIKDGTNECSTRSPFVVSIFHVLGASSLPKVLWIYASLIVAGMADLSALNRVTYEFAVDQPVGQILLPSPIFPPSDLAITMISNAANIIPAACFEIDLDTKQNPLP